MNEWKNELKNERKNKIMNVLSSSKVYHLLENTLIYSIDKTNTCKEHIQYLV